MSKYSTLWEYIARHKQPSLDLSFEEIKEIIGFPIDHSFLNYKKELVDMGYRVKKIYLKEKRVTFEKI